MACSHFQLDMVYELEHLKCFILVIHRSSLLCFSYTVIGVFVSSGIPLGRDISIEWERSSEVGAQVLGEQVCGAVCTT